LLAHLNRPRARSRLRVREPQWLTRGLDRAETAALLGSFRTDRARAIAGLMLFSGLRSAQVLGLAVADLDIPRGRVRVMGKGGKERRVPLDPDVAGLIQAYLLAERPETSTARCLSWPRAAPRPAADRRRPAHHLRYHRGKAGIPAGYPHALRHSLVICTEGRHEGRPNPRPAHSCLMSIRYSARHVQEDLDPVSLLCCDVLALRGSRLSDLETGIYQALYEIQYR